MLTKIFLFSILLTQSLSNFTWAQASSNDECFTDLPKYSTYIRLEQAPNANSAIFESCYYANGRRYSYCKKPFLKMKQRDFIKRYPASKKIKCPKLEKNIKRPLFK